MKVGVVGLGAMGSPMALNLLDAGHELLVYDLSSSAVAALVAKGARAAVSPREAAAGVDVVLTMVPNDKVLREVTCNCLLYTSPSPRDNRTSRMPSSA